MLIVLILISPQMRKQTTKSNQKDGSECYENDMILYLIHFSSCSDYELRDEILCVKECVSF